MDDNIITVLDDPEYVEKMNRKISALEIASKTGTRYIFNKTASDLITKCILPMFSFGPHPTESDIPEEEERKRYYKDSYDSSIKIRECAIQVLKDKNLLCPMNQEVVGYKKCVVMNKDDFNDIYHARSIAIHESLTGAVHLIQFNQMHEKMSRITYIERSRALDCIVTLKISKNAKRVQPLCSTFKWFDVPSAKCRADRVKVLSMEDLNGNPVELGEDEVCVSVRAVYGILGEKYKQYKVGHMIYDRDFDDNIFVECSSGIAFFTNKKTAKEYNYT